MKTKIILLILAAFSAAVLFFWNDITFFYSKFSLNFPKIEGEIGNIIEEAGEQIFTPPPLRVEKEEKSALLTSEGVIQWTNAQRAKFSLPALKESANLDVSAAAKIEDMFESQYFAHASPLGGGVADLSQSVGYGFIIIGENLALGNFTNDEALVLAWMDSPGHRENILNENYQDIGVAVQKGTYEGKTTWMAVQHFGKPLSACLQPSELLKAQIDANKTQISTLEVALQSLQQEIQSMRPKNRTEYNQKVEQYNALVSQYNNLILETKILVDQYNADVRVFNTCASGT